MIVSYLLLFAFIYDYPKQAISIDIPDSEYSWPDYVKNYSTYYDDLVENNVKRRLIFEENVMLIKKWNEETELGMHNFTLGVNFMTAMTEEERKDFHNILMPASSKDGNKEINTMEKFAAQGFERLDFLFNRYKKLEKHEKQRDYDSGTEDDDDYDDEDDSGIEETIPEDDSFDWSKYRVVSPVKYQGRCAGCYAFSSIDAIESHYAIRTGELLRLSSQMVIDCTRELGNKGCKGGWIEESYKWLIKHGVALEKDYPFTMLDGKCKKDVKRLLINVTDYVQIAKGIDNLKAVVGGMGPVAVTINANPKSFELYRGEGVYDDPACDENILSHTGLLVGFGIENGVPYWLVKNSWGEKWGDKGYIKIKRDYRNVCGVASKAYIPILKTPSEGWKRFKKHNHRNKCRNNYISH